MQPEILPEMVDGVRQFPRKIIPGYYIKRIEINVVLGKDYEGTILIEEPDGRVKSCKWKATYGVQGPNTWNVTGEGAPMKDGGRSQDPEFQFSMFREANAPLKRELGICLTNHRESKRAAALARDFPPPPSRHHIEVPRELDEPKVPPIPTEKPVEVAAQPAVPEPPQPTQPEPSPEKIKKEEETKGKEPMAEFKPKTELIKQILLASCKILGSQISIAELRNTSKRLGTPNRNLVAYLMRSFELPNEDALEATGFKSPSALWVGTNQTKKLMKDDTEFEQVVLDIENELRVRFFLEPGGDKKGKTVSSSVVLVESPHSNGNGLTKESIVYLVWAMTGASSDKIAAIFGLEKTEDVAMIVGKVTMSEALTNQVREIFKTGSDRLTQKFNTRP